MPVQNSNYGSKISARKQNYDSNFRSEYKKLLEKKMKKGGRLTESEERKLEEHRGLDQDNQLERGKDFLDKKHKKLEEMKQLIELKDS